MAESGDVTLSAGSVSTNGEQIAVAATSSPGTLLHTAVAGVADWDSVEIELFNTDPALTVTLTLQWGGTAAADARTYLLRPHTSTVAVGRLNGAKVIRAFASTASVINACVAVDRYTL